LFGTLFKVAAVGVGLALVGPLAITLLASGDMSGIDGYDDDC